MTQDQEPGRPYTTPRAWVLWGGVSIVLTVLSAAWYMLYEYQTTCGLRDAPLPLLVTLNAVLVYAAGWLIAPRLGRMLAHFPRPPTDTAQGWVDRIIFSPSSFAMAPVWGAAMATGLLLFDPWHRTADFSDFLGDLLNTAAVGDTEATAAAVARAECMATPPVHELNRFLAIFIFCGNLIVGAAFATIGRFWWVVLTRIDEIDLRILNLSRDPLPSFLRVNSLIVATTALVASLSILSLIASGFHIDQTVTLYSLFSMIVVVATYAVPILPLSNRLRELKSEALDHVETRIEAHVRARSGLDQRADGPAADTPLDKLEDLDTLLATRELVHKIQTLPPGGQVSVSAAGIVAFLSFLPTLIDYLLN